MDNVTSFIINKCENLAGASLKEKTLVVKRTSHSGADVIPQMKKKEVRLAKISYKLDKPTNIYKLKSTNKNHPLLEF